MQEHGNLPMDDRGLYFAMSFIQTLISKGAAPNQLLQWDMRYEVDPSGTVTMDHFKHEPVCRG
jgi:hypothetical protein